jgi:hypothetical protein
MSRMSGLPPFNADGLLPPGDYELTLNELRSSPLVVGPSTGRPTWDASWRGHVVDNLEVLVGQLRQVGVREIYIDGSFVEDKLEFPSAFRISRCDSRPRGIVKIGARP